MKSAQLLRPSIVRFGAIVLALASLTAPLPAHYLWWELKPSGQPALRFGEFENDLREKSPGRLDTITGAAAFAVTSGGKTSPETLERKTSSFAPAGSAKGLAPNSSRMISPSKPTHARTHRSPMPPNNTSFSSS